MWVDVRLRHKARGALESSRERLGDSGERIAKSTREAAEKAEDYVRENPWHGVGVGAAVGVLIGILISRR
ncbi:hypothetical protein CRX72_05300 [Pantoea sp. BRM17]|nr:hypothetical protein CRX72_05300 [Pantoea sp. BRM17]